MESIIEKDEYLEAITLIPNESLLEVAQTDVDDILAGLKTASGDEFYISWEVAREELARRGIDWSEHVSA